MGSLGGIWRHQPPVDSATDLINALQRMALRMLPTGADRQFLIVEKEKHPVAVPLSAGRLERPLTNVDDSRWGWFMDEAWYSGREEPLPFYSGHQMLIAIEGQLYELDKLRANISGSSPSDNQAALVYKGFVQYGHDFWPMLHGQFIIAIWDNRGDATRLHFVRDRAGVKPFFYCITDKYFLFGSNIRTLLASGMYQAEVDWQGIWQMLSFPAPPQPSTVFKGVKALSRGHFLTYQGGTELVVQPYWQIPTGQQEDMSLSVAGLRIHESLETAIARRISAPDVTGSLISGGVDSPYICALLNAHVPKLKALTFAISGPQFAAMNEHELAGQTAERYGMEHIISFYAFDDIWRHFDAVLDAYEQPGINLDPYYFTGLMAKENGVKYLFNGLSADELHGGFHYFKYIPLWHIVRLFPWLTYPVPRGKSKRYDDLKNLTIPKTIDEYYSHGFSVFQEQEKQALLPDIKGFNSFEDIKNFYLPAGYTFKDDVEGLLHMMYANVPNHHLYRFEQFTQMFGVQAVYPFVDNDAVDLAFTIPSRHKVHKGVRKVALKEAAQPYIYRGSIAMKKKGITMPYGHWINHELKDFVTEKLASLKQRPYFDAKAIDKVDQRYRSITPAKVWKLVMIELWLEKFIDNKEVL